MSPVQVWERGPTLEVGESYQLIWNLSDANMQGNHGAGNVTWNATVNSSVENSTISGLADGIYYFQATLKKNNVIVAFDATVIVMGNNTGGNY